jgi:hypothetical protein
MINCCTVVASDKTGELTVNQETASSVVFPDGVRVAFSGQRYNDQGEAALANGGELGGELAEWLKTLARDTIPDNEAALEHVDGTFYGQPAFSRKPYATPTAGIYLCSASSPPGGALGMCGYHATQAALRQEMKPMWSVV